MHIAFDWDDTLYDLQTHVASAISTKVGYTVLPQTVDVCNDWRRYFGVNDEEIVRICDICSQAPIPGMLPLLRELLFCGHTVTVLTARRGALRFSSVSEVLKKANLNIKVLQSSRSRRARDVVALNPTIYFDDSPKTIYQLYNSSPDYVRKAILVKPTRTGIAQALGDCFKQWTYPNPAAYRLKLMELGVQLLPPVIGLSGKAQSGKDTIARILCKLDLGYQQLAFAHALKDCVKMLINDSVGSQLRSRIKENLAIDLEQCPQIKEVFDNLEIATIQDLENKTELGRTILQKFGTEVVRNIIGGETWRNYLKARLNHMFGGWVSRAVISDVRFPDEMNAIDMTPGSIRVNVIRPNRPGLSESCSSHSSEVYNATMINRGNVYHLVNDVSEEKLTTKVVDLLKKAANLI